MKNINKYALLLIAIATLSSNSLFFAMDNMDNEIDEINEFELTHLENMHNIILKTDDFYDKDKTPKSYIKKYQIEQENNLLEEGDLSGKLPEFQTDEENYLPSEKDFFNAIDQNDPKLVSYFLSIASFNFYKKNSNNETILYFICKNGYKQDACKNSYKKIIKILLENDAHRIINIEKNGKTPLSLAVEHNDIETVELLLNYGAKNSIEIVDTNYNKKCEIIKNEPILCANATPIYLSIINRNIKIFELLIRNANNNINFDNFICGVENSVDYTVSELLEKYLQSDLKYKLDPKLQPFQLKQFQNKFEQILREKREQILKEKREKIEKEKRKQANNPTPSKRSDNMEVDQYSSPKIDRFQPTKSFSDEFLTGPEYYDFNYNCENCINFEEELI